MINWNAKENRMEIDDVIFRPKIKMDKKALRKFRKEFQESLNKNRSKHVIEREAPKQTGRLR